MSRIIVKGLPKHMTEDRLKNIFSEKGHLTDCSLKYTKEGAFRRFAFVGYSKNEDADKAITYFNNTFIDASRIVVEYAKDFGDASKPRAWSKYSSDSSAYKRRMGALEEERKPKETTKDTTKSFGEQKLEQMLGDVKDDPNFQEFIHAHQKGNEKSIWGNDSLMKKAAVTCPENVENSSEDKNDSGVSDVVSDEGEDTTTNKDAVKESISDLDYLKSKMKKKSSMLSDEEESEEDDDSVKEDSDDRDVNVKESVADRSDDDSDEDFPAENKGGNIGHKEPVKHVVKIRGLPTVVKQSQLRDFFIPLKVVSVRIPHKGRKKSQVCMATVEFQSEEDTEAAMRRTRSYIGGKKVFLHKVKKDFEEVQSEHVKPRPWEEKVKRQMETGEEEEPIAESGRLFLRNLPYSCTEDDLEELFSPFGPLNEVNLPVDRFTKRVKGFAFITFMMPEHAVNAFTKLDGTVFQGRMLHILPAKENTADSFDSKEKSSFKKEKEEKQKASASSSHNWNTLFLGANAVADVMAEKYGKTKSQILDTTGKESLGVRMALGETQIVAETREFLVENGVHLDAFSQAVGARSKTVILAKNLPAGTTGEELLEIFSKYGSIANLILPPSGVTAIIEYLEPSEARNTFTKLAYTKFKHLPLYLEWAPQNVFADRKKKEPENKQSGEEPKTEIKKGEPMEAEDNTEKPSSSDQTRDDDVDADDDEQAEPNSVIFVKNLNFDTTEEGLKEKFKVCGKLRNVTVSRKKDMKHPGELLSMGYGFVEYKKAKYAEKAMKTLQHTKLDGHQLELKMSNRSTTVKQNESVKRKKQDGSKKQTGTKILVRNIPFEAKVNEIKELFSVFGEIKSARLPKKLSGTGSHRGFGFVDFLTKQDAKRAFNALCHSTHLYGRRLVLEWAEMEQTVDDLRHKTAQHFHTGNPNKRLKKSDLTDNLDDTMDD